jgi:sulfite exporter TauE/SafE
VPPTLLGALATGLLGGFGHCAAMCGPLVAAVSLLTAGQPAGGASGRHRAARLELRRLAPQALYNAGRITTYAFAGLTMGIAGSAVNVAGRIAGLQEAVALLAGLLMILLGLGAAGLLAFARHLEERAAGKVFALARGLLGGGQPGRAYALGLLLGLLPCGLSWSIFIGAAATGDPLHGAAFALTFGAGTAVALLLLGGAAAWLSGRARGMLRRLGGLTVALLGLRFLLHGLGVHAL